MNRSDVITVVLVAGIGLVASYFAVNALLGDPSEFSVTYKYVDELSGDLASVSADVFNSSAINPTVEVYVGSCYDTDGDGVISAAERTACATGSSETEEIDITAEEE